MPTKAQTTLPTPPEIPASNASYAKIADRLFKAAQAGQRPAVIYTRDAIKGTNTYCRMLRRYADTLLDAVPEPAPAPVKKAAKPKKTKVTA